MVTDLKTPQEERAISAFRNMDERAKQQALEHMEYLAEQHPYRPTPKLRVVKGGAS